MEYPINVAANGFHHWCFTYNDINGEGIFYYDGVVKTASTPTSLPKPSGSGGWYIGGEKFNKQMDGRLVSYINFF